MPGSFKVVFTSCMDAERQPDQPVWARIADEKPDALLLLGDQIYMDWGLGRPKWPAIIDKEGDDGRRVFAREMHLRYSQQAAVPGFRNLLQNLHAAGKRVIITWDDHDFAWNNSVGAGPDLPAKRRKVDDRTQLVSRFYFEQFKRWACNAPASAYPEWGGTFDKALASAPAPVQAVPDKLGGMDFLLLDSRSYRTLTPEEMALAGGGASSIIGPQYAALEQMVKQSDKGLCIVASGTPLRWQYRFSDGAWDSSRGADYPELAKLLDNAKRPVLFVSGDVHRNSWGGRLKHNGAASLVAQVLATAAAVRNIGPKKFAPSFGTLKIDMAKSTAEVTLLARDREGTWPDPAPVKLGWTKDGWAACPDGEANVTEFTAAASGDSIDEAPLFFCSARTCIKPARLQQPFSFDGLADIDAVFSADDVMADGRLQAGVMRASRAQGQLTIDPGAGADAASVFRQAFQRAGPHRSVVLFVHGLGKSAAAAIDEAYALRAAYPGSEVVLMSWPAGDAVGLLDRYIDFYDVRKRAVEGPLGSCMRTAVTLFGAVAKEYPQNVAVVLARSAGALALHGAISHQEALSTLGGVRRIVLSAPLVTTREFTKKSDHYPTYRYVTAPCELVVMTNPNDKVLSAASWLDGPKDPLGLLDATTADPDDVLQHATYIDFSNLTAMGPLHNMLIPDLGTSQRAVNREMLCAPSFDANALVAQGHLVKTGDPRLSCFKVR